MQWRAEFNQCGNHPFGIGRVRSNPNIQIFCGADKAVRCQRICVHHQKFNAMRVECG